MNVTKWFNGSIVQNDSTEVVSGLKTLLAGISQSMIAHTVLSTESSPITIDTGFGAVLTGPVIVQIVSSAGVVRTVSNIVLGTGVNAGKITITCGALATGDVISVLAVP